MEPKPAAAHVLLIEDNPGDADLVRLRLVEASSDLEVACVNRLSSGLQSLAEKTPSVVLLDLNLPDSRGADTFRTVLKKAPTVPIVVLSGLEDEVLAAKAVHHGVQDYLIKGSFDSKQLARAIRYAIERQALLISLDMSRKQQLQFKDEFLSHVSHELRTPLTSIHQFATILLDGLAGDISGEQREHLSTILGSVNQLRTMIDDLLEATRAEAGKLRVEVRCIEIGDVVQQAVNMLRATAQEKHIGLEMTLDSRIPLVLADPDRVLQILINLIDNALKFTPADGTVMVKPCLAPKDPDHVCISVTDTGRGIRSESKHLIFERLYQDPNSNNNSRKGLGLGLYIVQELVRLQAGRIWVESQLGDGSEFSFTLPLFSLSKLLSPVISAEGKLQAPLVILTVELIPIPHRGSPNWSSTRQQCMSILRSCICPDKDVVLPAMSGKGGIEVFLIVGSADEHGTNVLLKRIAGQLERSSELQNNATFKIAVEPVLVQGQETDVPLEKLVQQVADAINRVVMIALRHQDSESQPNNFSETTLVGSEMVSHKSVAAPFVPSLKPTKRGTNGQAKNTNRR